MIRDKITDPWREVSWEEAISYAASRFKEIQQKYGRLTYSRDKTRILLSPQLIIFDDPEIGTASVADILRDPQRFEGKTSVDPLEPYGPSGALMRNRAIIVIGARHGDVLIYSQLHGGLRYVLCHDMDEILATIEAFDGKALDDKRKVVPTLVDMLMAGGDSSPVSDADEALLIEAAKKKSGIGARAIKKELAGARVERQRREEEQRTESEADFETEQAEMAEKPTIWLFAGERRVVADQMEAALVESGAPLYQRSGKIVTPVFIKISNDGKTLPPSISEHTITSLGEEIEAAAVLMEPSKDPEKPDQAVSAPDLYVRTLMERMKKPYRVLKAIVNAPLVLPSFQGTMRTISSPRISALKAQPTPQ
jgi:hypothetical protein